MFVSATQHFSSLMIDTYLDFARNVGFDDRILATLREFFCDSGQTEYHMLE
jgi:hypothetical protein